MNLRILLRTAQTLLPWATDLKAELQRAAFKAMGRPFEADLRILSALDLPAEAVVVDIGANRGFFIDAVRMLLGPQVEIVAFEPQARLARRLEARAGLDGRLTVRPVGLAKSPGAATLYTPIYNGYAFDGLASAIRAEAADWLADGRILGFDPRKLEVREDVITLARLDDFGLSPHLVKIDVQGFEDAVLEGATETLTRARPVLIIETPAPDGPVPARLSALGYRPFGVVAGRLEAGRTDGLNTYYLHETRHPEGQNRP